MRANELMEDFMRIFGRHQLFWKDDQLFRWGSDDVLAKVAPDAKWPGMWRIHANGRISDMVNLSRAKDSAMSWALGKLNRKGQEETAAVPVPDASNPGQAPSP